MDSFYRRTNDNITEKSIVDQVYLDGVNDKLDVFKLKRIEKTTDNGNTISYLTNDFYTKNPKINISGSTPQLYWLADINRNVECEKFDIKLIRKEMEKKLSCKTFKNLN